MSDAPRDPFTTADTSMAILRSLRRRARDVYDPNEPHALRTAIDALDDRDARWALYCFATADAAGWPYIENTLRMLDAKHDRDDVTRDDHAVE
ncbi:hypothetical protein FSW04_18900 [Baekduia soli]|uniref:Uncharacterized protein n=1 Tax=Baekduia soli TaxID=496014 RepID=A0A5B8U8Q3_9ACTN|nr:hypothetical protein [Baekduia soli]QEC49434.1 hypothetical protein FSW04_18900 [Baekduia soli]